MPKRIEKKTWPEMFEAVSNGIKTFDMRLADFDVKVGDILVLREWDPKTGKYTGRSIEKSISYFINTKNLNFWKKEEIEKHGFLIMALK